MMDLMEDKDKAHVPKFSSFKPKVENNKPENRSRRKDDASRERERSPERHRRHGDRHRYSHGRSREKDRHHKSIDRDSRRHRDDDDHHHHHHNRHSRHHDDDRRHNRHDRSPLSRHSSHTVTTTTHTPKDNEPDLYFIDTQGDIQNITYGSLHKYDVPYYHRTGRGRVLGLPSTCWIDRDSLDGKSMILRTNADITDDGSARKKRDAAWKQARNVETLYRVKQDASAGNSEVELDSDYISLESGDSKKRRRGDRDMSVSEYEDEVDYRSIEGKAKASLPSNITLQNDLTPDNDAAGIAARLKNAHLSKHVAEHPDDIDGWLALIDHQSSLVGTMSADNNNRILTASEKRSVADIRLSIYEKALSSLSAKTPRDRLVLGLLEEGAKLWDTKLLARKWQDYLQRYPNYMSLWVRYLDFQQTNYLNFTYEKCRDFIIECIELNKSSIRPQTVEEQVLEQKKIHLYLLLRLSLLMRESGFCEHAVALWQALLEYNFFRPKSLTYQDPSAAIRSFSAFWDSEVPRIGEVGAKGWDASSESKPPAPQTDEAAHAIDLHSPFESWERAEWECMRTSSLPARTLDETQEDDPYRIILSSDIEKLLADFTGPEMQGLLLNAFLLFCRLPPFSDRSSTVSEWCVDPFVFNQYLDTRSDFSKPWFSDLSTDLENKQALLSNTFPLQNILCTPDTLFPNSQWFSVFNSFHNLHSNDSATLLPTPWIRRAIRHLVTRLDDNDELAQYSVALEYTFNRHDAKAYVKRLLKQRPSCFGLYNCYALMEVRDGNVDAAERVWETTCRMGTSVRDCSVLWVSWLWALMEQGKMEKVGRLLVGIVDGRGPVGEGEMTPAEILRVQRFLTETAEHALATSKSATFLNATECLALLHYITTSNDLSKALQIYDTAERNLIKHFSSSRTSNNDTLREILHQSKSKLLHHHSSTIRLYKPSLLREELQKSISLFPSNTMFLGLFVWNEAKFRIDDRVRSIMRIHTSPTSFSQTSPSSQTILHLYTIFSELHRGVSSGSTIHSVRAAFEAAVSDEKPTRSYPLVWKLYILFECCVGHEQKVRDVYFRAVRACPWVKELVMVGFREGVLRRGIASTTGQKDGEEIGQLRKVWNVLVEKELRVHVDLEEWFDDQGLGVGVGVGGEGNAPIRLPVDEDSMDES